MNPEYRSEVNELLYWSSRKIVTFDVQSVFFEFVIKNGQLCFRIKRLTLEIFNKIVQEQNILKHFLYGIENVAPDTLFRLGLARLVCVFIN